VRFVVADATGREIGLHPRGDPVRALRVDAGEGLVDVLG
jgi:hypothetical protein